MTRRLVIAGTLGDVPVIKGPRPAADALAVALVTGRRQREHDDAAAAEVAETLRALREQVVQP